MSGLDRTQFKNLLIRPTLDLIGLGGDKAVNLVLGTALVESRLTYLKQVGAGPALGLFQMEPATHDDLWDNYLKFRPDRLEKLQRIGIFKKPEASLMISHLAYAAVMCRLHYTRAKDALPRADDATAMAVYHKIHYNTALGKANVALNIPLFQEAIIA